MSNLMTGVSVAQLADRIARIPVTMRRWFGTTVSAAYTLTPQDRLLRVDTSGAARTITLPLVNTVDGQVFTIKNISNAGNAVTINRAGADTIDGATSLIVPSLQSVTLIAGAAGRWDVAGASYEAGLTYLASTWTPVLGGAGGTSGQTYTYQRGLWVKNATQVWAAWELLLSAKGTITGQAQISGFPYAANAAMGNYTQVGYWDALATSVIGLTGYMVATTSALLLYKRTAAVASAVGTTLVTADINNTTGLGGFISYQV